MGTTFLKINFHMAKNIFNCAANSLQLSLFSSRNIKGDLVVLFLQNKISGIRPLKFVLVFSTESSENQNFIKINLFQFLADYEAYIKSQQEMMYQTQMTAYVQEPKVAEVAPPISYGDFEKEYEKEQALIRKKMAKDTVMVRSFVEDEVCLSFHTNFGYQHFTVKIIYLQGRF